MKDKALIWEIFHTDEEIFGEILHSYIIEAEKRNLIISFHNGEVVITREEYGI